jgi:hypothetical protein
MAAPDRRSFDRETDFFGARWGEDDTIVFGR